MPTSITGYTTFVSGTTISSSEVNANFSNHRGDLLPINTNTASASTITHGLGTAEHRWAGSFVEKINFGQTTTSWRIEDDTTTVGNLVFKKNGTTLATVNDNGFSPGSLTKVTATIYSISSSDAIIIFDASSNTIASTLPPPSSGLALSFIKDDATFNNCIINSNTTTATINGTTTISLFTPKEGFKFVSDGTTWFITEHKILSSFAAYNPTTQGLGTPTSVDARWRRVGDSMHLLAEMAVGTVTAVEVQVGLPGSFTIDSGKIATLKLVGSMGRGATTTDDYQTYATGGDAFVNFGIMGGSSGLTPRTGSNMFADGNQMSFYAIFPITGWEG